MVTVQHLPVRTASPNSSIWRHLSEDVFRSHLVQLEKATRVPSNAVAHHEAAWRQRSGRQQDDVDFILPFLVEERLANDVAFLAAAEEGVKAVSAVCIEEAGSRSSLVFRLAANEGPTELVQETLQKVFLSLMELANGQIYRRACSEKIFDHILRLQRIRILARLRSRRRPKPPHLAARSEQPLHTDLRNLLRQRRRSKVDPSVEALLHNIDRLCLTYQAVDEVAPLSADETERLRAVVIESYNFSTADGTKTLEGTFRDAGAGQAELVGNKNIKQVNKLGAYWRAIRMMTKAARRYPELFSAIRLDLVAPYNSVSSHIAFEKRGKNSVTCHVHAEVQMVTFYELRRRDYIRLPRVIGTSKAACYLCNLFVQAHGGFFLHRTHGKVFDQWTIPDLAEFTSAQISSYCRIISLMDTAVLAAARVKHVRRPYPMESRQTIDRLLPFSTDVSTTSTSTVKPEVVSEMRELSIALSDGSGSEPQAATTNDEEDSGPASVLNTAVLKTDQSRVLLPLKSTSALTPDSSITNEVPLSHSSMTADEWRNIDAYRAATFKFANVIFHIEIEQPRTGHVVAMEGQATDETLSEDVIHIRDLPNGEDVTVAANGESKPIQLSIALEQSRFLLQLHWHERNFSEAHEERLPVI